MRTVSNWVAGAIVATSLASCGQGDNTAASGAQPTPAPTAAEQQALLAALPAPYNTADLENGRRQFGLCRSCHTVVEGGPNMTGPNLHGVFGRPAASVEGYRYSEALQKAGFVWDAERLDAWLANPRTYLPGNRMTFVGLDDPKKRIDLIAYLKVESGFAPGEAPAPDPEAVAPAGS
ncbi:cytochrome c family protein [Phenylobacterium sp.]|uniref:c-type cytochrome n=1 Tax=Phenylobacterium sp. TaxID=1871053 RepID=UPI00272F48AF|nr:cytochrome c family protein [Phenylobacterium sp.]MDP1616717.1 cytochrome c family protein [Phenylobacterium sp.]MDP1987082.1 cytochrome c family protein [Phenylobacterium sp.]